MKFSENISQFAKTHKVAHILIFSTVFFCVGFIFGRIGQLRGILPANVQYRGSLVRMGNYNFINPLLWCEIIGNNEVIPEYQPMKEEMRRAVDKQASLGNVSSASVFLSTLNTGRWFGVNENEQFSPASMLKVVIMMAYFKMEEDMPGLMDQTILYDGSFDEDAIENVRDSESLIPNKKYTIAELIENMIVHSGNNSRRLLKDFLQKYDSKYLDQAYSDLRLGSAPLDGGDFMSPRQYSSVFRVLYNATYLTKASSEKALEILSRASFKDGLVAGAPSGILVSHKFGERKFVNPDGTYLSELHDCGIVYYPQHPYFLCIMTKGNDQTKLRSAVADLSKDAYTQIDNYFKNYDSKMQILK